MRKILCWLGLHEWEYWDYFESHKNCVVIEKCKHCPAMKLIGPMG